MVYARIIKPERMVDPFDRVAADIRAERNRPMTEECFQAEHMNQPVETTPKWQPPTGAQTFASVGFAEAKSWVGRDAIIREDPYFGRRGRVKEVIVDSQHGFLVLVQVYKKNKTPGVGWEFLDKPGDLSCAYWPPGKVEFA